MKKIIIATALIAASQISMASVTKHIEKSRNHAGLGSSTVEVMHQPAAYKGTKQYHQRQRAHTNDSTVTTITAISTKRIISKSQRRAPRPG